MVRFVALTFGGGNRRFNDALTRFKVQFEELEIFDEIITINDKNLKEKEEFWEKNGKFIENNKRGYGYWVWKSYLIKEQLKCMSEGDILFYADVGCEVDNSKRNNFMELKEYFMQDNSVPILARKQIGYKEEHYCKMDTFVALDCCDASIMKTPQYQSGILGIKNCQKARDFVEKWYYYSCLDNYHLVDDTPSKLDNAKKFIEHRHDQSILSILYKKTFPAVTPSIEVGNCVFILRTRHGGSRLNRVYRKC